MLLLAIRNTVALKNCVYGHDLTGVCMAIMHLLICIIWLCLHYTPDDTSCMTIT